MALRPLFSPTRLIQCALAVTLALAVGCAQSTEDGGGGASEGRGGDSGSGTGVAGTRGSGGEVATGQAGSPGGLAGAGGGPSTGAAGASSGLSGTAGSAPGTGGEAGAAGTSGGGGKPGSTGAAGATGKAGSSGAAGATGRAGSSGAAGSRGAGGGAAGASGSAGSSGAAGTTGADKLVGWAAAGCSVSGVTTTTGGGSGTPVTVTSAASFNSNASGTTARVIQISGSLTGDLTIGSNKTIVGLSGAKVTGHIELNGSANVIIQNLTVVGYNCSDVPSDGDCQDGADAITVDHQTHHLWIDHLDISDGSDGNLDITNQSDCVTVSWTKFHYSASRVSGYTGEVHHFSNLVGASDNDTTDTGHLRVTWHHDWWATNVVERMPRVRFGDVHVYNSLYTASGDNHCVAIGDGANVLLENNVFVGVKDPVDSTDYSDAASIVVSRGNVYTGTSGQTANKGTAVFTPGYPYALDAASAVESEVQSGAGPR
jgi:pectate lyase